MYGYYARLPERHNLTTIITRLQVVIIDKKKEIKRQTNERTKGQQRKQTLSYYYLRRPGTGYVIVLSVIQ